MNVEERMLELATNALGEQERQVVELRSRAPTLLAAGAVVASLLTGVVLHESDRPPAVSLTCLIIGGIGAGALFSSCLALLWPRALAFTVNATDTYRWLFDEGLTTAPDMNIPLADNLTELWIGNATTAARLATYLRVAVVGIAVEAAGLASAALLGS